MRNNLNYTKPLVATIDPEGCYVQHSHQLNALGYFSKGYDGKLFLFHILMWEHFNGKVPEGYVLHHSCRNRGCFNPKHLALMTQEEHMKIHGQIRSAERDKEARPYWEATNCSGEKLGHVFGVSGTTGRHWIRRWKGSEHDSTTL